MGKFFNSRFSLTNLLKRVRIKVDQLETCLKSALFRNCQEDKLSNISDKHLPYKEQTIKTS